MQVESSTIDPVVEVEPLRLVNTGAYKTNEYSGGCRLFKAVSAGLGVELTPQDIQDWEVLLGASFIIDALMDEGKQDIRPFIDGIVAGDSVPGVTDEAVAACHKYVEKQPEAKRESILEGLRAIGDFPKLYLEANNADELIDVRLAEADIYAGFLKLDVLDQDDAQAREAFNRWIEIFSRGGYTADALFDLRQDYKDKTHAVEPTFKAHVALAKAATRELIPGFRATPIRALGRTARLAFEYVVGDRSHQKT